MCSALPLAVNGLTIDIKNSITHTSFNIYGLTITQPGGQQLPEVEAVCLAQPQAKLGDNVSLQKQLGF